MKPQRSVMATLISSREKPFAIRGFTESLRSELRSKPNVSVTCVYPGGWCTVPKLHPPSVDAAQIVGIPWPSPHRSCAHDVGAGPTGPQHRPYVELIAQSTERGVDFRNVTEDCTPLGQWANP